jgi:CHAD domain-containing protein
LNRIAEDRRAAASGSVFVFAQAQARERLGRVEAEVHAFLAMPAGGEDTVEAIHRLRVSLRRFRAVLDTFPKFFPARERQRIRGAIRIVFGAAGEVRNRDIAAELVAGLAAEAAAGVTRKMRLERLAFEQPLRDLLLGWVRSDFAAQWRQGLRLA